MGVQDDGLPPAAPATSGEWRCPNDATHNLPWGDEPKESV